MLLDQRHLTRQPLATRGPGTLDMWLVRPRKCGFLNLFHFD